MNGPLAVQERALRLVLGPAGRRRARRATFWNGVRNHAAKLNLMAMKKGDHGFFYHSNDRQGDRRHRRDHRGALSRSDRHAGDPWVVVDIRGVRGLPKPVTLAAVKAEPNLARWRCVKLSRLSVQPVTDAEWKIVCKMGGLSGA